MKEPKLTIALAERGEQPVLLFSRNDNNPLKRIDINLARLAGMGYMGACEQIGNTALRMVHPFTPNNSHSTRPWRRQKAQSSHHTI